MLRMGELLKQGIAISANDYDQQVQYEFTKLNEIKPAMIEEATKNARAAAEKLHIIITVYDQQGNTITKKDLKDVEIKQNNQTICSLNLFDGEEDGSTADFHFDPTWEGYIEAEF